LPQSESANLARGAWLAGYLAQINRLTNSCNALFLHCVISVYAIMNLYSQINEDQ